MSGERRHFHVDRTLPLIDFLAGALGGSRRAAKRRLDARTVFVNGRRIWMARHPLKKGDGVEVVGTPLSRAEEADLRPLYDEADYLVLDKPAGWTSTGTDSVEARLRRARADASWAAVHRLDRDTTGCLLFARGESARARAVNEFRRGAVEKTYEAIVLGRVPGTLRRLESPIEGRTAVTRVSVRARGAETSWLRIGIETGRTHQIRRHLAGAGYPVLGDRAYGTARALDPALRVVPRPILHALRLRLPHPGAKANIEARAPRPRDFNEWLHRLGLVT